MKKTFTILILLVGLIILALFIKQVYFSSTISFDKCIKMGGSINNTTNECHIDGKVLKTTWP